MIVDNFDQILDLLEFNSKEEFYFTQVIQRKKDGNETGKGNNGSRTIKTYYSFSREHLESKREKIKELCRHNNARAYIYLNRRNSSEISCGCISVLAEHLKNGTTEQCARVWDHAIGKNPALGYKKKWMLDIDSKDEELINEARQLMYKCRPIGNKEIALIPTLKGYHLITAGFDTDQYSSNVRINPLAIPLTTDITILKDTPTLLYYEGI